MCTTVVAVLVSATKTEELRKHEMKTRDFYRNKIFAELFIEGTYFIKRATNMINPTRLHHVWRSFSDVNSNDFSPSYLAQICERYSQNFMVIHRNSTVLKKCGQYQDLMLLSAGERQSFSYCDQALYGKCARLYGQSMFLDSDDVDSITGCHFDYTLVLDSDTEVGEGVLLQLLEIAAAHPDKAIIQPAIKFTRKPSDTVFMWLESTRQMLYEPTTNAMAKLLRQSGYFGKALLKNDTYIRNVIGTRQNLIERIPINVLSHDTFEAAILKPMYINDIYLIESPCYNYVSWYLRETRWNKGELILATYFWRKIFGNCVKRLQKLCQGGLYEETILRTETKLDITSSYIAHAALRQIAMKPLLLISLFLQIGIYSYLPNLSLVWVIVLVLLIPKIGIFRPQNVGFLLVETFLSVLQFTPEAVAGTFRIIKALHGILILDAKWIPQRAVEEEFRTSSKFLSSFKYLWMHSAFAVTTCIAVYMFRDDYFFFAMMATVFALPLFNYFTSLNVKSVRQALSCVSVRSLCSKSGCCRSFFRRKFYSRLAEAAPNATVVSHEQV